MSFSEPPPKPRRRSPRPQLDFTLDPSIAVVERLTPFERAKRLVLKRIPGFALSFILHACILVSLGYVAIKLNAQPKGESLIFGWDPPGAYNNRTGKRGGKPVELNRDTTLNETLDLSVARTTTPTKSTGGTAATSDQDSPAPIVRPVNVGGALGGRGSSGSGTGDGPGGKGSGSRGDGDGGDGGGKGKGDRERAIRNGLDWLKRQQLSDGRWELHQGYPDPGYATLKTDTGATTLALLAFLGHGDTHQTGTYKKEVKNGLSWLCGIQDTATGDLHDQRQEEGRSPAFYSHAIGTIVLCEALAMTGDNELRPFAERAVKYLLQSQHPQMGGWKYRPLQKEGRGDLSVTGWALMALHSARIAGIPVEQEEFERAAQFLDSVQVKGTARYKYESISPDSKASPAMTAEAILCRQWLGWPKDYPQMAAGVKYVLETEMPIRWEGGRRNVYAWYYTSQVLHNLGGDEWQKWNDSVRDILVRNQVQTGSTKQGQDTRGSWHPTTPPGDPFEHSEKAGRLYMTVMCILNLETPTRHQPIYGN